MKKKSFKFLEITLIVIIILICGISLLQYETTFGIISKIINNKLVFGLFISIPFISLVILEVLNISKETKNKEETKEIIEIENQKALKEVLEKEIETKIECKKELKNSKKLDQTIQIPLLEIQKQIKAKNTQENNLEDTLVLFDSNDIKEAIKKELSTKTVDKKKKTNNKSTENVDNTKTKDNKSTETVDKEK